MQLIEKNSFNVRSAIYHLKKDGSDIEFMLFPMIHVGSKEFYVNVSRMLADCDLILAEGVNTKKAKMLTLSYSIVRKIRRMNLVTQREGLNVSEFREKIVNSDMEGAVFDERWSTLPFSIRVQLFLGVPVYAAYLFLFGTRETIAETIALEDLPSSYEILISDEDFDKFDSLLVQERDQKLIDKIENLKDTNRQDRITVGVVYGAMHMRGLMNHLLGNLKYQVVKAEWVKVFDL